MISYLVALGLGLVFYSLLAILFKLGVKFYGLLGTGLLITVLYFYVGRH